MMLVKIFAETAPRYWAKGLPVIPLRVQEKKPILDNWQLYCESMPTEEEQRGWLFDHTNNNIGLPLGKQSNLIMIDIDTDDPAVKGAIMEVLAPFPSPWKRVGRKGMVLAYKQPPGLIRSFKLKDTKTKAMLVEGLSSGNQVVIPPSIHPDTKRPYEANCDLVDVLDQLVALPADIEDRFRAAFERLGIAISFAGMGGVAEYVSSGNRDNKMTQMAGLLAWSITRGEKSFVEAEGQLQAWHDGMVQKVAGDDIDIRKGVQSMCGFLVRDVMVGKKTLPKGWDAGLGEERKKSLGLTFDHEYEEWTYEEITNYIRLQCEQHGTESSGWIEAIEYVLERINRSQSLSPITVENILRYIYELSGKRTPMGQLRARLKSLAHGDLAGNDHNEIAEKVIEDVEQFGEVRYAASKFWQWSGSHWQDKEKDDFLAIIARNYGSLAAGKRRSDHVGILNTISSLKHKELQTLNVRGVNFANGFLTEELKLVSPDKEYGCTYTLPYRYLADAAPPKMFLSFLDRCFKGDTDREDKKLAIQEAIAATLLGLGPTLCRAVLLFGPAHTGKSEMLRIVEALVPDEVRTTLPPDQWSDKFGPAQLAHKLLNIAGELSGTKRIDGTVFKKVIGGDSMNAQFKGQQIFDFNPTATHWFASNHTPKTDDTSGGFLRRWLLIRFERPITAGEKVLNISYRIVSEEREAIVAWAMQAVPALIERAAFTLPSSHDQWLNEIGNNNNSVRHFLKESGMVHIPTDPIHEEEMEKLPYILESKLYEAYTAFCLIGLGGKRTTQRNFRMQLRDLQPELNFRSRTFSGVSGALETRYYNMTFADQRKTAAAA